MAVDPTELLAIATRVKRATRQGDVIELCEAVLSFQFAAVAAPIEAKVVPRKASLPTTGCSECERRRGLRTAAQQRWRSKRA